MKPKFVFLTLIMSSLLAGCGTLGGMVDGAGEDLNRAGKWIKNL
jgi:predicted small secreted protein